jgi:hypothetical protein
MGLVARFPKRPNLRAGPCYSGFFSGRIKSWDDMEIEKIDHVILHGLETLNLINPLFTSIGIYTALVSIWRFSPGYLIGKT